MRRATSTWRSIDVRRKLHDPAGVEAICREALENQKQTIAPFVYHYYQAQALAELGRTREAIAAIERAIQETGHNGRLNVKLNKVHVLSLLQKWDDAVAYANKLFDEYPALADRQEVRYNLAIVYSAAGKLDLAESQLRAILDVDPDHAGACNNLGYQFAEQGRDLDAAERLIRHAIEVDRYDNKKSGASELENGMYLDSLGWVLFRKGKLAEARAELERAVTLFERIQPRGHLGPPGGRAFPSWRQGQSEVGLGRSPASLRTGKHRAVASQPGPA